MQNLNWLSCKDLHKNNNDKKNKLIYIERLKIYEVSTIFKKPYRENAS